MYPRCSDSNPSNTCNKCHMSTGCCPNPLAIALRVMLPESSLALMNISHLRCGPVGVRFMRLRRIYRTRNDGRHKCRPYKDLKRKFLYYQVTTPTLPSPLKGESLGGSEKWDFRDVKLAGVRILYSQLPNQSLVFGQNQKDRSSGCGRGG